MKSWKTSSTINLHLKDASLIWVPGFGKQWETSLQCAVHTHTVSPFVWCWLGLEGQIFSPCSLSGAPQWASPLWQRVQLYPLWNAFTNILCASATGIKHRQSPPVPNFSSFHTSMLQMTTRRITRNSSKFLALGVPMIPVGMQKRPSLFFPLKIMYFPGTVQTPQRRHMRNLFWELGDFSHLWKDFSLLGKGSEI